MIKTLLAFLSGSIFKINQTNKTVYLSDGSHWNSRLFHQNLNLLRAFLNHSTTNDPEYKVVLGDIENYKKAFIQKKVDFSEKLKEATKSINLYEFCNYELKSGSHKGKKICDIAKSQEGINYLNYLCGFKDSTIKKIVIREYEKQMNYV